MIVVTTETINGRNFNHLGMVCGSIVTSKNFIKDFGAGLKTIVGGELVSYTKMLSEARDTATQRMISAAQSIGADAVVNVRYSSSAIMQGSAEVLATGTAIKFID